ncbi:unnamed protein product [Rhodiola kirilowii]
MEELNQFKRSVRMFNSGLKNLNAIVKSQRVKEGHRGLGFTGRSNSGRTMFVKAELKPAQRPKQRMRQAHDKPSSYQRRKMPMTNRGRPNTEWRRDTRIC